MMWSELTLHLQQCSPSNSDAWVWHTAAFKISHLTPHIFLHLQKYICLVFSSAEPQRFCLHFRGGGTRGGCAWGCSPPRFQDCSKSSPILALPIFEYWSQPFQYHTLSYTLNFSVYPRKLGFHNPSRQTTATCGCLWILEYHMACCQWKSTQVSSGFRDVAILYV